MFTGVSSRFGPPEVVSCGAPKAFAHCTVVKTTTLMGWLLEYHLQFSPNVTFYSAFIITEDDTGKYSLFSSLLSIYYFYLFGCAGSELQHLGSSSLTWDGSQGILHSEHRFLANEPPCKSQYSFSKGNSIKSIDLSPTLSASLIWLCQYYRLRFPFRNR